MSVFSLVDYFFIQLTKIHLIFKTQSQSISADFADREEIYTGRCGKTQVPTTISVLIGYIFKLRFLCLFVKDVTPLQQAQK